MKLLILITPNWLKDFAGGWVFYTVLPRLPKIHPSFIRIARFGPVIGIILGFIQATLWLILKKFEWPNESLALLTIALGILLTGGLHLDGLIDTADGIGAGRKKRLEAMQDSRVGSIGVLSLVSLLAIQVSSLLKLGIHTPIAIIAALFWGRFSSIWAISFFPYLHAESKPGLHQKHWKGFFKESQISLLSLLILIFFFYILPIDKYMYSALIPATILGIIPSIIIPHLLGRFLKGHSGDSYGACVVLVETFMLFLFSCILI